MVIYDGFDSHIEPELIDYCAEKRIIPFCLPPHTSHKLQPLNVGVFSALQHYYGEEVNKTRVAIDKDLFPNLLARARRQACTTRNIKAGFRHSGIEPYNPIPCLEQCNLQNPPLNLKPLQTPTPIREQSPHQLLSYNPSPPINPLALNQVYNNSIAAIEDIIKTTDPIPVITYAKTAVQRLVEGGQICFANQKMHEAGEAALRDEIVAMARKGKADKRWIPKEPGTATILEKENELTQRKRERDQKETQKRARIAATKEDPDVNRKRVKVAPTKPSIKTESIVQSLQSLNCGSISTQAAPPPQPNIVFMTPLVGPDPGTQ